MRYAVVIKTWRGREGGREKANTYSGREGGREGGEAFDNIQWNSENWYTFQT